jgi:hypothetical protein
MGVVLSPDGRLVEISELREHPYMVGSQFHPEFKSRPTRPHPLFLGLIKAAQQFHEQRHKQEETHTNSVPPSLVATAWPLVESKLKRNFPVVPFLTTNLPGTGSSPVSSARREG